MAEDTLEVLIRAIGADATAKSLTNIASSLKKIQVIGADGILRDVTISKNITQLKKMDVRLKRFNMNLLSTMFMGMQLQRTFGGLFKNMMDTFKKMRDKSTNPLSMALTRLEASFTFLKFSIIEAMSPLLTNLVITFAEWAVAIANMDPRILEAVGVAIGLLWIAGIALFTGSQIKLFADAVSNIIKLGSGNVASKITNITGALKGLSGIIGIALTVHFAIKAWKILSEDGTTIGEYAGIVAEATIAGALIGFYFGPGGALVGGLVGLAVGLIITLTDVLVENWDKITEWFRTHEVKLRLLPIFPFVGGAEVTEKKDYSDFMGGMIPDNAEAIKNINENVIKLAELATPESITAMQKLWDEGVVGGLSTNITETLIPSFQSFGVEVDTETGKIQLLISAWENWKPTAKDLKVKVTQTGSSIFGRTSTATPYGS